MRNLQYQASHDGKVKLFFIKSILIVTIIFIQFKANTLPHIAITAANLLNDKVLLFYSSNELPILRILTDRGTEYCGKIKQHDYQLYLVINDIDSTKTKAMSPQTNGICERLHKTILQEFYQVTFRKKLYDSLEALQKDLDQWLEDYNNRRTHQGKVCCGRTPMATLLDGKLIWAQKNLTQI